MEEVNQELMMKLSMFEKQIQQIQQQLQAIDQAIVEMNSLNIGLNDLVNSVDKEILAPLGKGIFAKTRLLSENLIVDIGEKKFITKNIPDTKKMIEKQITKLENVRKQLEGSMENINEELTKTMLEAQKKEKEKN
jgi:prefoldin alpha subunit